MPWPCTACRGENPAGTKFCGHCGRPAAAISDAPRVRDESRLITALFADISGFTALADALDADELHEIIAPLIARLAGVGERYEGFVAKFAGDALLIFFGAPIAQEDHAVRALLVALELHRELEAAIPDIAPGVDLDLHIGVNSGRVVSGRFGDAFAGDYSILGDAVNLAQRLESIAPAGSTYVGETTQRLASARFEMTEVGELSVKGKASPISAWRLERELPHDGEHVTRASPMSGPLVGRHEEVTKAAEMLDELVLGRGGVLAITGDAGAGKSKLGERIRQLADERGLSWLDVTCISYGGALAYRPYADLLRRSFGIPFDMVAEEASARLSATLATEDVPIAASYLARVLGLSTGASTDVAPEAFRRGLHDAFASWARNMAANGPFVLAVNDFHWADPSSRVLTLELARLTRDEPMLVLVTARTEAAALIDQVAGQTLDERRLTTQLQPLRDVEVDELIAQTLGASASPGLCRVIRDRSAGNPFFAVELTHALRETGAVTHRGDGWQLVRPGDFALVPDSVEGVLAARLDGLSRSAALVLQRAAVIGRRVRMPLLRAVCRDQDDLDESLRELNDAGLLEQVTTADGPQLRFHHALVVDVAYARLVRRERRELHLAVADAGERLYGADGDNVDLLARHLYLGDAGARATPYLRRAGERAARLFANDEAVVHLERAAELARRDPATETDVPDLLLQLADLHELRGAYGEAFEVYDEVRAATNDVRAWQGLAATVRRRGRYTGALALLEDAFQTIPDRGQLAPLWLERGWNLSLLGRTAEAIDALQTGLRNHHEKRDATAGQLLLELARTEEEAAMFDEAVAHGTEAERIYTDLGDLRGLTSALRVVGGLYRRVDRIEDAMTALQHALTLAEQVGSAEELGGCLLNLGMLELEQGQLDSAIERDRRAIAEFERIDHGSGRAIGYGNLGEKLLRAGQFEEGLHWSERAAALAEAIGLSYVQAEATMQVAQVWLREGRAEAAANAAEVAGELFAAVEVHAQMRRAFELAVESWERAGDANRARVCATRARSAPAVN